MTLKVHHLRPAPGAKTAKTRKGRGEGSKILDIGSAWGYNVLALTHVVESAIGMDLVGDQFEAGVRIARANDMTLPVIGADASALPFEDGSFTGITMVETLEHIFEADRPRAIRAWMST